METKFTKGEWKATIAELKDFFLCAIGSVETKRVICHTNLDPEMTSEECKANAKLIAAAPELLEACVCLVRLKDLVLPPEPVKGVSEEFMSEFVALNNLIKIADSAIKKATE